jgi:hypothetical protein
MLDDTQPEPDERRAAGERMERLYYALSEKLLTRLGPDVDPSTEEGRREIDATWQDVLADEPDAAELSDALTGMLRVPAHPGDEPDAASRA